MTRRLTIAIVGVLIAANAAGTASAADWTLDGKLRLGGVWLDQEGNESTMPETYDIYDGFFLSSIYLKGRKDSNTHVTLDLTDINQDNRKGVFDFRQSGLLHVRSRFTESRWVFDPTGVADASRRNWNNRVSWTPYEFLWFSADYNLQTRDGDRIGLNPGLEGWLGTGYNSELHRYRFAAQARANNGIGGTVAYDGVTERDAIDHERERDGYVVSANLHVPGFYIEDLTHVLRGAVGRSEIRQGDVGFDMINFQYTGIWRALDWLRLRYRLYSSEVEDEATTLKTNNYRHDFDGTLSNRIAVLMLGYGWEGLDDDRAVTTTNKFRGSFSLRDPQNRISGRVSLDARDKEDAEAVTLLQDVESQRFDVRVDARPIAQLSMGARYSDRDREYPNIRTEVMGQAVTTYAAWSQPAGDERISVTQVGVEYTYSDDEYDNRYGRERITSHAVTGRVGVTVMEDLDLMGSFTYLSLEEDLDLDKSIVSVGAGYRFPHGFLADVKYNAYNYDDYLLSDRVYTANVIWFNVGYEFNGVSR